MPCMAMYSRPGEGGIDVGKLVRKALVIRGMSAKTAAIWMSGDTKYETTLSLGLNGRGPLDMHAVMNLPTRVIWKIFQLVIRAKLKKDEADTYSVPLNNERKSA